jgi:hypothetical protein
MPISCLDGVQDMLPDPLYNNYGESQTKALAKVETLERETAPERQNGRKQPQPA